MSKVVNILKARLERFKACREDAIEAVISMGGSSHHFERRIKHFDTLIAELDELLDIFRKAV